MQAPVEQWEESQHSLPAELHFWLLSRYITGAQREELAQRLVERGIDRDTAIHAISSLERDPEIAECRAAGQLSRKLASLADTKLALAKLSRGNADIPRWPCVSRQDFLENYYSPNRSVILTGIMSQWRALHRWTPDYLKAVCGKEPVQVMMGRESDPQYEINAHAHKKEMPFQDYVDLIANVSQSNDYYMVATNYFLYRPCAAPLFEDMDIFPEYLTAERPCGDLWLGPAGTFTPLHHDMVNVLFVQVKGRKQFTLVSPEHTHLLRNKIGIFSEVNPEAPEFEHAPESKLITRITFVLNPGEVLFIPVGWWHCVRSLDLSMSLSFSNFVFPNEFDIYRPEWGTGNKKK